MPNITGYKFVNYFHFLVYSQNILHILLQKYSRTEDIKAQSNLLA